VEAVARAQWPAAIDGGGARVGRPFREVRGRGGSAGALKTPSGGRGSGMGGWGGGEGAGMAVRAVHGQGCGRREEGDDPDWWGPPVSHCERGRRSSWADRR
jgi:hypothetical protein